jgi:hypothetical protein
MNWKYQLRRPSHEEYLDAAQPSLGVVWFGHEDDDGWEHGYQSYTHWRRRPKEPEYEWRLHSTSQPPTRWRTLESPPIAHPVEGYPDLFLSPRHHQLWERRVKETG